MAGRDVTRTVEAVWRIESARLIAGIARLVRDVALAEDLAQEALIAALEQWPESGVPENPGAWLMATAKHRGIDRLRRAEVHQRKTGELGREAQLCSSADEEDLAAAADDPFDDDLLRLIFTTCHPVLSTDARVALTLRLLCGLTTSGIARAYLASESTVAQRIVRAKRTLSASRVPFVVPEPSELRERLASVLDVVYLIFNEGYAATAGERLIRPELIEEALRLGRILAELLPREAEVHGLVALMELQASRTRARTGLSGEPVLLLEQDRTRWDRLLVARGLTALKRACATGGRIGPYTLQASIAACHAGARRPGDTDWDRIVALYDGLAQLMPSPVVELNRAVPSGWPTARKPHSKSWSAFERSPPSTATTCCPACAPNCSNNLAATLRPAKSSSEPRCSPRTRGSAPRSSNGPRHVRLNIDTSRKLAEQPSASIEGKDKALPSSIKGHVARRTREALQRAEREA